jgi:hypothetical protein
MIEKYIYLAGFVVTLFGLAVGVFRTYIKKNSIGGTENQEGLVLLALVVVTLASAVWPFVWIFTIAYWVADKKEKDTAEEKQ